MSLTKRIKELEDKSHRHLSNGDYTVTNSGDKVELQIKMPVVDDIPPSSGGSSSGTIAFAEIVSGEGLTYVANIFSTFNSDMTAGELDEEEAEIRIADGSMSKYYSLTAGEVYPVSKYFVNDVETWVIIEHAGTS